MEWQPIETAPKDGTLILGYFPQEGWWKNRDTFIRSTRWVPGFMGGWAFQGDFNAEPSHCMPLPPLPGDTLGGTQP